MLQKPLLDDVLASRSLLRALVCKEHLGSFGTGSMTRPTNYFFDCFPLIAASFLLFSLGMTDLLFFFLSGFAKFSYSCNSWSVLRVLQWL